MRTASMNSNSNSTAWLPCTLIWPQTPPRPFWLELNGVYSVRLVTRRSTRWSDSALPRFSKYTACHPPLSHCSSASCNEVSVNVHRPVFLLYSMVSPGLQLRPQRSPRLFLVTLASLKSSGA